MCSINRPGLWLTLTLLVGCAKPVPVQEIVRDTGTESETAVASPAPGDWPWWRGPTFDGKSSDQRAVRTWSKTKNLLWKAPVAGRGHASPIVSGERVFLNTAVENAQQQLVVCFDRNTGKQLWSTVAHQGGFLAKHGKNSHASATPACDGERVYSAFINSGALRVTATDLDGKTLWQSEAGPFRSEHGYGSSPVLYKSLVIVSGDNLTSSFIAALDHETGEIVWRTARRATGRHGSYATPIVGHVAGKAQLLLSGTGTVSSYDPDTGKLLWFCAGPAEVTACTVAFSDQLVFASGGYPDKEILAIRADGSGDVTNSHVVWRSRKGVTYVPSPAYHDGRLYVVNDSGITTCFDGETGKQIWQGRLDGSFSASPVLAGGLFYVTSESGKTFVFKAGPKFELIAENDLGEDGLATLAICGGTIFLRTSQSLYSIGESTTQRAARP